jgi:hypothetical protein
VAHTIDFLGDLLDDIEKISLTFTSTSACWAFYWGREGHVVSFQSNPTVTKGVGAIGCQCPRGITQDFCSAGIVRGCTGFRTHTDQLPKLSWPQNEHKVGSV